MIVFSAFAIRAVAEPFAVRFGELHGCRMDFSWATAPALAKRLEAGEPADLVLLNRSTIDALKIAGRLLPDSDVALAGSATAIAVRAGMPHPDISTPEALKKTLLEVRAVSYTDPAAGGASGIYFSSLIERLGIADEVNAKTRFPPPNGYSGALVASGDADLAIQQVPELLDVPGIEIVGPLPGDLHRVTLFVAGIPAASREPALARAFIDLLRTPEAQEAFRRKGLDPA